MLKQWILFCLLLVLCGACSKTPQNRSGKPLLLVSIAPYRFLTEEIAGDEFEVRAVVPAAANPHSFEPTASQVFSASQGAVWFAIGEPFERKLIPILKQRSPELVVVDLREGIELIEEGHELGCAHSPHSCAMDRHIWLSPKLAGQQAKTIEQALSKKFPEYKEKFEANFENLQLHLIALNKEIEEILKGVEDRTLLVSHPAFGYFCKEYGLRQLSVEYEGKDPRPKHLEEILARASAESMALALALPQYNNKGAQLIAEKLHVPVHMIDPYSADYFETMRKLAHLVADAYAD